MHQPPAPCGRVDSAAGGHGPWMLSVVATPGSVNAGEVTLYPPASGRDLSVGVRPVWRSKASWRILARPTGQDLPQPGQHIRERLS
jgi:hypothetical protein